MPDTAYVSQFGIEALGARDAGYISQFGVEVLGARDAGYVSQFGVEVLGARDAGYVSQFGVEILGCNTLPFEYAGSGNLEISGEAETLYLNYVGSGGIRLSGSADTSILLREGFKCVLDGVTGYQTSVKKKNAWVPAITVCLNYLQVVKAPNK